MKLWQKLTALAFAGLMLTVPAQAQFSGNIPEGYVLGNKETTKRPAVATPGVVVDPTGSFYKAGNALFPIYATASVTSATSVSGSPLITVTNATGIGMNDLITASFVPFGAFVTNIVGNTVTMSQNATATNPVAIPATFGFSRFSFLNSILTNTVGGQNGYFGTAARGHSTWPGALSPALDLGWSSVYSISPIGQTAVTAASRSSDNLFPGSNTIASLTYVVADNPSIELFTWGHYVESTLKAGAVETSHIQYEGSLDNHWIITGDEDPYNINPLVGVRNMRLDNGKALQSNVATVALDIVNNASGLGGGTYRSGIIFHETALDFTDLRPYAPAIAMAAKHSIDWFTNNGGVPSWSIWADGGSPTTFRMRDVFNADDFLRVDAGTGIVALGEANTQTLMRGPLQLQGGYTVATLPVCNAAMIDAMVAVTDATAPTYRGAPVGGGGVRTPVYCDGVAWTTH